MDTRLWLAVAAALIVAGAVIGVRLDRAPDTAPRPIPAPTAGADEANAAAREAAVPSAFGTEDELCAEYQALAARQALDESKRTPAEETAARNTLLASQSPEVLASVALLSQDPAERMDAMTRAMATGRRDATVAWSAVLICDSAPADLQCPAQEWEDELLTLDKENSQVWIRVAASRYEQGDFVKALDALHRAAAAAETREYMVETVQMVERALDSAGGYSFPERSRLAFAVAAANLPAYAAYVSMCEKESEYDAEWAQACFEYGQRVERQAKTMTGVSIAQAIEIAALDALKSSEEAEAVAARKQEAERDRELQSSDPLAEKVILSNPRHFAAYLALIKEQGELAAGAQLRAEASRIAERCLPKPRG